MCKEPYVCTEKERERERSTCKPWPTGRKMLKKEKAKERDGIVTKLTRADENEAMPRCLFVIISYDGNVTLKIKERKRNPLVLFLSSLALQKAEAERDESFLFNYLLLSLCSLSLSLSLDASLSIVQVL